MSLVKDSFYREHERQFAFAPRDEPIQIVNVGLIATYLVTKLEVRKHRIEGKSPKRAVKGQRKVFAGTGGSTEYSVYDRDRLAPGNEIEGPAIIEARDSTTVVLPDQSVTVDEFTNLILEKR
jgi:N-methylhydantoinase A